MTKRVYLDVDDFIDLPEEIVRAIQRAPKVPPLKKKEQSKPKAFANPMSWGYGGGETPWPFDVRRAYVDARYRTGIRNAIASDWTASNWKYVAQRELARVLDDLLALEYVYEEGAEGSPPQAPPMI